MKTLFDAGIKNCEKLPHDNPEGMAAAAAAAAAKKI